MSDVDQLFEAIKAGDAGRLGALLQADPRLAAARDPQGVSAVMSALYLGRAELAEQLAAARPTLDLFECVALGRTEAVAALLRRDSALVGAWSPDGFSALHFAAFFDRPAPARLLLDHGADPSSVARNPMAVQPLHSAAAARAAGVAELLLGAGADPNARQHGGWAPLHAAAANGDSALACLLLAAGADRAARNDDGKSPRDLAAAGDHGALLALLEGPPGG